LQALNRGPISRDNFGQIGAALLAEWGCNYLQGKLIGLASIERP